MKSRLNMFLLALVVICLVGLIGISIYFQTSISEVNARYNLRTEQLLNTKEDLQQQMNQFQSLNTTYVDLSLDLESYTTEFEQLYGLCSNQKTALEVDLDDERAENTLLVGKLSNVKAKITTMRSKIIFIKTKAGNSVNGLNGLQSDAEDISDTVHDQKDEVALTISECRSYLGDVEGYVDDLKSESETIEGYVSDIDGNLSVMYTDIDSLMASLRGY